MDPFKDLGWTSKPPVNKIDLHHHFVPDFYVKAVEENGGDPSGWPTPKWAPQASKALMQHQGVKTAVLSLTAPGACIIPDPEGQAALARQANDYAASLRDQDPQSFGFFATLPDIKNTSAALTEIKYALDDIRADGVTLFTRYDRCYLGHADIEPIWQELDKRKATVFVHPTYPFDTHMVSPRMPLPLIDFPHETTRAAVDMMTSGTLQKYPNVKVILSHAGGSLPYLISRMLTPLKKTEELGITGFKAGVTHDQALSTFRSFYYDTALSSSPQVLRTLLDLVPHDHIVFGSDFPYAPPPAYSAFLGDLESFEMTQELRDGINFGNAQILVPRLKS